METTFNTHIGAALLEWYDKNARDLPWRVGPAALARGERPDPYRVWLSEIMLQQTTVAAVRGYFSRFVALWPDVNSLARGHDAQVMAEWAGLGYYARARNLLKCARKVQSDHNGIFPETEARLRTLPGIGPYTAAAIAAIAFDQSAVVVDGNVERVMARLFAVETPLPAAKRDLTAFAARLTPVHRPGCHAQAVMDLGATICTPRSPVCGLCPVRIVCAAHARGLAADLPYKTPKTPKPVRFGIAYVVRRADGAMLLETRPAKGLLGGMLGWPGSDWAETPAQPSPPIIAQWHDSEVEVRHTFTHFHLRLSLRIAEVPQDATPLRGTFYPVAHFQRSALPTVMRKAFDVAQQMWEQN